MRIMEVIVKIIHIDERRARLIEESRIARWV